MKKRTLTASIICLLLFSTPCSALYVIGLKNGRQFETSAYRQKGNQILFYSHGGVIGIDNELIESIHPSKILPSSPEEILPSSVFPPAHEPAENTSQQPGENPRPKTDSEHHDIFHQRFDRLKTRFETAEFMENTELEEFAKALTGFRDDILRRRLGKQFSKEVAGVYEMLGGVESIMEANGSR